MFEIFKFSNKKGALQLSINAIVIVVLAMTLLGLGLGFIRGMFKEITGISTEVQEQVREQITAQLRTTGEKISFPRSVDIGRGDRKVLTIGVQNTGQSTIFFGFNLTLDLENSDHNGTIEDVYDPRYASHKCAFSLSPAEADAFGINLRAPRTGGTDMLVVNVVLGGEGECGDIPANPVYASKTTFVTVG